MHINSKTEENTVLTELKSKLGVRLFFFYLICYAGFVILGVFHYELLAITFIAGINLAMLYGIGLIVFAIILGVIYNHYCSQYEDRFETQSKQKGENV